MTRKNEDTMSKKKNEDNQPISTPAAEAAARAEYGDGDGTIPTADSVPAGLPGEPASVREGVCADHFHHSHGHLEESLGFPADFPPVACGGPGKCSPCTLHREIVTSRQQRLADPAAPWIGPDGKPCSQEQINEAGRVAGDLLTRSAVAKKK